MKSIKYILSTILLLGSIVSNAQCLPGGIYYSGTGECVYPIYNPLTIYTPNNSPVFVREWVNNDWTQKTKTDMVSYYQSQYSNRLSYQAEATVKYNCHAWAWTFGTTYWMNAPEQTKYFAANDKSYVAISNASGGAKVHFTSDDHSAIVDSPYTSMSPYWYVFSKWGTGPLFKHRMGDSPYNTSKFIFYGTPEILGDDRVCSSSTYTLNCSEQVSSWSITNYTNAPFTLIPNGNSATVKVPPDSPLDWVLLNAVVNGVQISKVIRTCAIVGPELICYSFGYTLSTGETPVWSLTNMNWPNGFVLSTANNGATAVVTATSPTGQTATLQAVAGGRTHTLNIKACMGSISGPDYLCGTATYTLEMGTAEWWTTGGEGISIVSSTPTTATVTVDPAYNGMLMAVIARMSGGGIGKSIIISCGRGSGGDNSRFVAYPNPTSNVLNIEVKEDVQDFATDALQSKAIEPNYNIRLYDSFGILQRQITGKDSKVSFNVANLPNGFYYLHIYDGVHEKPEIHQIIISHK